MTSKRLCAFILPYYGKLPNYFQLFLNSCATNPEYDWLLFTDDHTEYDYPVNVHVQYETFADMQHRVESRFNGNACLNTPYKLCDFKPIYGYLFEEYLENYRFWGYCDCDVIFGQLNHFITETMLNKFDKIFAVGHLSLMRNTKENNRRFMLPLDGQEIYRKVVQSDQIFTFDESYLPTNINRIYVEHDFPIYLTDLSGNTRARSDDFELVHFDPLLDVYMTESPLKAVYTWRNGELTRAYRRLGEFVTKELMYMHFQRRSMKVRIDPRQSKAYTIIPGSFEPLSVPEITAQNFDGIRRSRLSNQFAHRWSILCGDVKFWRKKVLTKLRRR